MNKKISKLETHSSAIRTVAAFSGLELNIVVAEFEQKFAV